MDFGLTTGRGALRRGAYAGVLVAAAGALAWATGHPFLFPSLGPTAYVMATLWGSEAVSGRRVVGGHAVGVAAGLLAHWTVAPGLSMAAVPPGLSVAGARLAAAGVLSVGLTTVGMLAADAGHPPACATTLIVALGLLPSLPDAAGILLAVVLLYACHAGVVTVVKAGAPLGAPSNG